MSGVKQWQLNVSMIKPLRFIDTSMVEVGAVIEELRKLGREPELEVTNSR